MQNLLPQSSNLPVDFSALQPYFVMMNGKILINSFLQPGFIRDAVAMLDLILSPHFQLNARILSSYNFNWSFNVLLKRDLWKKINRYLCVVMSG
jgi:hypothetical protein